jgi:hypothetical protein
MSRLRLCSDDPLLGTLRDLFDATPLRQPEQRVRPLSLIAARHGRARFVGQAGALLAGATALEVPVSESRVAPLTGKRSRAVTLDVGVRILEGLLPAFGLAPAAIDGALSGARQVAFAFPEVRRVHVDLIVLGRALAGRALDAANPVALLFMSGGYEALLVDSVLTSRSFALDVTGERSARADFDFPAVHQLIGDAKAGISVETSGGRSVVVSGPSELTFAFSCVRLAVDAEGGLIGLEPHEGLRSLGFGRGGVTPALPDRVLLGERDELLEWDV